MSEDEDNDVEYATPCSCCASCGIAEIDDVKLVPCDGCDRVRYCGDECQELHLPEHEEACKKRAVELRDELLFKQPESTHLGDCPICCLPIPLDDSKYVMNSCCSKVICNGCLITNAFREKQRSLRYPCPFCRKPMPKTEEEHLKQNMKRVEANDPAAIRKEGMVHLEKGRYKSAFEYWEKAAELGDAEAHFRLSVLYIQGLGVEKDEGKYIHHLKEAAISGHPKARYSLGCYEGRNGDKKKAVKHFIIAANLGHDQSLATLKLAYGCGKINKEDFAAALRAHQAAVDATKSEQREAAEECYESKKRRPTRRII